MELTVETAILHALDPAVDAPLLSEAPMRLTDEASAYLQNVAAKAFSGDETKVCELSAESGVAPLLWNAAADFTGRTASLARDWFRLLQENPSVPAGDVIFLLCEADGAEFLGALKLNYKAGYVHYFAQDDGAPRTDLVRQTTQLSGKADEAFFINLDTRAVRVLEKPYEIDGHKTCYLAGRLLQCKAGLSPKQKLKAIQAVAEEVNQRFYGNLGVEESDLAAAVCEEYHASEDGEVPVNAICEKLYGDMPHAREAFCEALAEHEIAPEEPVPLSGAAVRRLEKQSLRSGDGVEIKVPVSLYKNEKAIEFIHNEDGTTSLLVKNILL